MAAALQGAVRIWCAYRLQIPQADPLEPSVLSEVKSCLATLELSTVTAETERKRVCVGICNLYRYIRISKEIEV